MFKPKKFALHELISPGAMKAKGEKCWLYFAPHFLMTCDALRKFAGPTYFNTWGLKNPLVLGVVYSFSGYHEKGEYKRSEYSRHRMFKAGDAKTPEMSAEDIRKAILGFEPTVSGFYENKMMDTFPHITEIEIGVSWFHFVTDTNVPAGKILCYKP